MIALRVTEWNPEVLESLFDFPYKTNRDPRNATSLTKGLFRLENLQSDSLHRTLK
jgi:hypothetical protein